MNKTTVTFVLIGLICLLAILSMTYFTLQDNTPVEPDYSWIDKQPGIKTIIDAENGCEYIAIDGVGMHTRNRPNGTQICGE